MYAVLSYSGFRVILNRAKGQIHVCFEQKKLLIIIFELHEYVLFCTKIINACNCLNIYNLNNRYPQRKNKFKLDEKIIFKLYLMCF